MKSGLRDRKKQQTHQNLLDAALKLMQDGKGLGELSLREVANQAGIVPAAFYRHFKSMEELGLALVDLSAVRIAEILKDARQKRAYKSALQTSLGIYFDYVAENPALFRFISRERVGGNFNIREKIRAAMDQIASEMAKDMRMPKFLPPADIELASELIVSLSFQMAPEFLDSMEEMRNRSEDKRIKWKTLKQLRLVFIGTIRGRRRKGNRKV
ncbi:MAG: TetR family transcriptional regulator [Leptospira sp.]|nr:TetR family transcriptional regulator [Leptospira sp.]